MRNNIASASRPEGGHSHQPSLRQRSKYKLAPLAVFGLLLCNALHAQGVTLTYDAASNPSDTTDKLLTIHDTANSVGPVVRSELDASNLGDSLSTLLNRRHSSNSVTVKSGTVSGNAYGAAPDIANTAAQNNQLTLEGGNVEGTVYGAFNIGSNASAENNIVTIKNGHVKGAVYGGLGRGGNSHAKNNTVTITGGSFGGGSDSRAGYIYGGYSWNGTTEGNHVAINAPGTKITAVFGGGTRDTYSSNKNLIAEGNTVTVTGGTFTGQVVGGFAGRAAGNKAEGNTVLINGADAQILGEIRGGTGRNAIHNTVKISSGSIAAGVFGGYNTFGSLPPGAPKMQATGNTVIIEGQPVFVPGTGQSSLPALYGGFSTNANPDKVDVLSGNTLEMRTKGTTVGNIHNFERINFYLPSDIAAGEKVLTLTDTSGTGIAGRKIGVELPAGARLAQGDRIVLIHTANGTLTSGAGNLVNQLHATSGSALLYRFKLSSDRQNLYATVTGTPTPTSTPASTPAPGTGGGTGLGGSTGGSSAGSGSTGGGMAARLNPQTK